MGRSCAGSRIGVVDFRAYVFVLGSVAMEVTLVLRRRVAPDALIMPSKICQLPPSMNMAPSAAMQTIASRPCI